MRVIVLSENRKKNQCNNEEGLSLYVEVNNNKLLLDTGITDLFIENSEILNIDLSKIEIIVLSHGHWDHGNGLKYLNGDNKTVILHPNSFADRYSIRRNEEYAGINLKLEEMSQKYNVIQTKTSYKIFENIWFLGEIERKNDFEAKKFPTILAESKIDYIEDDSGIVIKTDNGIIVISGCSHSGICNTIEQAKKIANENRICAVMGGFHLKEVDEMTQETIKYFANNNVASAYMGHCTSDEVINEFKKQLEGKCKVEILYSGAEFEL